MRTILVCVSLCTFASCANKLPPSFKRCNRKQGDFNTCLANAVEDAMRQLTKPMKDLGIPSLDPLEVESLTIQAGTSAVGLQQNFKDVKVYGITRNTCPQMDVDFEKKTIENLCIYPEIRMESHYDMKGKILVLDIEGSGPANVTLENVKIPVKYKFEEYQKNGKEYLKITHTDLNLEPEKVRFKFGNLFGGDERLSENVHQVLNENWKDVFGDVRSGYNEVFGQITIGIFNGVLERVPVSVLFDGE